MPEEDFGEKIGNTICISNRALRDRIITEQNIKSGNLFASKTLEDIAAHEYGHFAGVRMRGMDVAQKAYYNTYEEYISSEELVDFISENISKYAIENSGKEITSEVFARASYDKSLFVREYLSEVKRRFKK